MLSAKRGQRQQHHRDPHEEGIPMSSSQVVD